MGQRLKDVRKAQKMTQEELALKSGVSRGTIAAIESGRRTCVTVNTLLKIATALNTTVDKIFFETSV